MGLESIAMALRHYTGIVGAVRAIRDVGSVLRAGRSIFNTARDSLYYKTGYQPPVPKTKTPRAAALYLKRIYREARAARRRPVPIQRRKMPRYSRRSHRGRRSYSKRKQTRKGFKRTTHVAKKTAGRMADLGTQHMYQRKLYGEDTAFPNNPGYTLRKYIDRVTFKLSDLSADSLEMAKVFSQYRIVGATLHYIQDYEHLRGFNNIDADFWNTGPVADGGSADNELAALNRIIDMQNNLRGFGFRQFASLNQTTAFILQDKTGIKTGDDDLGIQDLMDCGASLCVIGGSGGRKSIKIQIRGLGVLNQVKELTNSIGHNIITSPWLDTLDQNVQHHGLCMGFQRAQDAINGNPKNVFGMSCFVQLAIEWKGLRLLDSAHPAVMKHPQLVQIMNRMKPGDTYTTQTGINTPSLHIPPQPN